MTSHPESRPARITRPTCAPVTQTPESTAVLRHPHTPPSANQQNRNPLSSCAASTVNSAKFASHAPASTTAHPASRATLKLVSRFYTREELVRQRALWKRGGKVVVFTNGCYDLLHPGHLRLLEQARGMGDVLVLALNSDAGVRNIKGPSRPLISENDRVALALALEAVDAVTLFDEETPRELISAVLPDILIKGADWSHFVAGREEVEASGGRVLTIPLEPGFSTTNIVDKILSQP